MTFEITGEHNTATVHTNQSLDEAEDEAIEQIQEMVDHEAFVGNDDVAIMPDFHWGAGAVIGFTMPVKNRIVPNTIGVDIGCGMYAVSFGQLPSLDTDDETLTAIDEAIRSRIPLGFDVHDRNNYHMIQQFPWTTCENKWDRFAEATDFPMKQTEVPQYPRKTYFSDLCKRVGYDQTRAINSMGTLGGGNHFIELGRDDEGNVWCVIHSGSRGIGAEIAQHWQDVATEKTFARNAEVEVPENELQYFDSDALDVIDDTADDATTVRPGSLEIDREAILDDYEGEAIEGKFGQLKSFMNANKSDSSPLDYLEGEEAIGYIRDMIFAQTYASESRKTMAEYVRVALSNVFPDTQNRIEIIDSIESVHNYIDFHDATIRKGACRAHDGERLVVPFNMQYGTIIARGQGKSSWNNSSAHGAGRAMSRTEAKNRFDDEDFTEQIGNVFMSKRPLDEIPGAYKSPEQVEAALGDSVTVEHRIKPFLSIKAE